MDYLHEALQAVSAELLAQRKYWLRTMPRGKHAAALFGAAAAPTYAAVVLLVSVIAVFYLKVTLLARSFTGCAPRHSSKVLGRSQCAWAALSTLAGLALFGFEVYAAGGGARLLASLGGGDAKPVRLPYTWALTFNSLSIDATFTLLASAPFLLRCLVALSPSLAGQLYPPFPPPAREGAAGGEPAVPISPALGSAAEALRALDCTDLLLARLLELFLLYVLHKYQR